MPPNLNYHEAACLPLVGLTSWQALVDTATLKPRQRILIHARSGGIGAFAIRLAKHIGTEVWTTTSGKNLEFAKTRCRSRYQLSVNAARVTRSNPRYQYPILDYGRTTNLPGLRRGIY